MTSVQVVTTASHAGYAAYAKRFLQSFRRHSSDPLVYYHESQPDDPDFSATDDVGLKWRNLDDDPDRAAFIAAHGSDPNKVGGPQDPNSQAIRFCHKVFALTDAAEKCKAEWLVWIDADVEVHAKPTWQGHGFLDCLPAGKDLAYLGRKHMYTECGFVGYRVAEETVLEMLRDMRRYYTTGEIFLRPKSDWHDSRCFDICRERSAVEPSKWHNISLGVDGTHVWPLTALEHWCRHHKGPRRKMQRYGRIVP